MNNNKIWLRAIHALAQKARFVFFFHFFSYHFLCVRLIINAANDEQRKLKRESFVSFCIEFHCRLLFRFHLRQFQCYASLVFHFHHCYVVDIRLVFLPIQMSRIWQMTLNSKFCRHVSDGFNLFGTHIWSNKSDWMTWILTRNQSCVLYFIFFRWVCRHFTNWRTFFVIGFGSLTKLERSKCVVSCIKTENNTRDTSIRKSLWIAFRYFPSWSVEVYNSSISFLFFSLYSDSKRYSRLSVVARFHFMSCAIYRCAVAS